MQKHIEDKLEKIKQLEEEAQRLAQAMVPLLPNGQSARKLHTDDDVIISARNSDDDAPSPAIT